MTFQYKLMKARILTLIFTIFCYWAKGQIVVNELMASNSNTIKDNTGAFSDWIEVYNPGNTTIDLHNHFLSDNPEKLDKFQLKSETGTLKIAPKGFLIIWCSGFPNRGSNHVSFSLSANAESIIISNPDQKVISQLDIKDQRKTSLMEEPSMVAQNLNILKNQAQINPIRTKKLILVF